MARKSRAEGTEEVGQDFARLLGERQDEMAERLSKHTAGAEELRPEVERACEAFQRSFVEDPDCYADFWVAAGQEQLRQGYSIKDIQDGMSISHRVISELIAEAHADDLKTMLTLTRLADDILDRARVKLGEVCATTYQGIIAEREQAEEKPRKGREHLTERKQAEEELEQKIKQLTDLNRLSQTVTASLEMERVLDEVVSLIHEAIDSDCTAVVMVDERGNLTLGSEAGLDVMELLGRIRSEGYTSWIFHTRQAVIMDDVAEDGTVTSQTPAEAPIILNPHLLKAGVKSLAGLPLIVKDRMLGVLFLHSLKPYHFHGQLPLLSTFANQAAIAIENARLVEEARQRARRLQTAAEVSRAASSVLDPNELIQQAVDLIHEEFNLYYVGLFLVDETGAWTDEPGRWAVLRAGTGEAGRKMLEQGHKLEVGGESMIGWCVANAQARIALDVGEEAVRFEHPLLPDTHSEMALPLISRGQVIGAVSVQSSEPAAFSDEDVTTLQTMTDQLANAIKNAHLYAEIRRRLDELTILDRVSRALTSTLDLQETLTLIVERTIELLGVAATSVSVYDEEEGDLWFVAASGAGADTILGRRLEMGQGIAGWVAQHGEPVIVPDVTQDARFSGDFDRESGFTTRSIMCVPLQSKGQTIGSIEAMNKESGPFDQQDVQLLASLAATAAIAIENARLFASIEAQVEERTRQVAIFQALVENATDAVAMGDLGGLVTYGNRAFYELFGYDYKSQELIGLPMTSFLPEEDHQLLAEEVMPQAMSGGWSGERRGQRKDGSLSEIRLTVFPVLDEAGQPVSLAAMIRDISERKRLEQQVRESLERRTYQVQTSTDVAQDIAAAPALDELFRRVVALVKERFGYYHAQVFRSDPQTGDLIMAEGYGEAGRAMKEAGHRIEFGKGVVGTAAASKLPVLVPDVSESPDWLPNPHLPETQGELAVPIMLRDRVLGVLDVQSEQAGLLSEEDQILLLGLCGQIASAIESTRLLEEVSIFRQFAEASGQGFAMGTLEGIITYVNPTICRLIEEDRPEDTYGKSIAAYYPEEMQQRLQNEVLPAVMQEGQWVGELALLSTKGKITPTIENLFLIRDEKGNPLYLADVMTDISERKQAEAEMEATLRELSALYRRYSREEWEKFLEMGIQERHAGYMYDQETTSPAGDFWTPEVGLAVSRKQPATSQEAAEVVPVEGEAPTSLVAPLMLRGEVIGAMGLRGGDGEKKWSPDDVALIEAIASQVALAVENARLFEQTQEALEETADLYRASRRVSTAGNLDEILAAIMESFDSPDISRAFVFIHEQEPGDEECVTIAANWRSGEQELAPVGTRLLLKENPSMRIMLTGEPLWITDVESDERLDEISRGVLSQMGVRSTATIPLFVHGRQTGAVELESEVPYHFTEREMQFALTLADQAAIAIENQRLFEEAQIEARQSSALYEASQIAGRLEAGFEAAMESLFESVQETADFDQWWVALLDESGEVLQGVAGYHPAIPVEAIKAPHLVAEEPDNPAVIAATTGEELVVNDPLHDERMSALPEVVRQAAGKFISMPVISGQRTLGIINVGRMLDKPDLTPRDVELARALANQVAVAAENRRLFGETERRARQLATAADVSRAAASILELDSLLFEVTDLIRERFGFYHVSIFLMGEEGEYAVLRESTGEAGRIMKQRGHRLLAGSPSIIGWVTANRRPRIALDVGEDPVHFRNELLPDTRSELAIPLISGEKLLGALDVQSTEANAFGEDDVQVLQILTDQIAVAIENAQAYQAQQEAAERIREADRLKTQFLANMSHELRTPLNSIIGFSRVILRGIDGPLTELQQQDLTAIYNSGQHLLGLINDMLDLSKIEAGKMDLAFEEIDLKEICKGVMSTAIALVKDKPIELHQEIDSDLPLIEADGQRIRQVVLNFLSNAAKFTEKGHISLRAFRQDDDVVVSVSDTGIGISEEHMEKIFKAFEQVDASPTRKAGGTGLGLAISRYFIEMHSGDIWAESQVGVGSTFYFSLPIQREKEIEAEREEEEEIDHSRRLVLAVDDDPGVVTLFKRYLEEQGYQVLGVGKAEEVMALAEELIPYAITLDILMPDKDGWEVIQELKMSRKTRGIPVVICSIVSEKGKGFTLGAADYLVKPIMEDELLEALARIDGKENKRVIIVDDQPDDIRVIRRILEAQKNYKVFEALGGQEGIDIIKSEQPDLIILDLMMPEVDGFAVLEAVKSDPATRPIPIIVITAKDLSKEDRDLLNGQIEVLLQKGLFSEEDLLQNIAQALERLGAEDKPGSE
jgi:PAS domain S-box-containing protein